MKVIRLKARAYGSELLCGKIQLSDMPRRIRLNNITNYIFAMRYYRYDRTIPNPLEVFKSDIDTLPHGRDREYQQSLWEEYIYDLENKNMVSLMGPFPKGIDMGDPDKW